MTQPKHGTKRKKEWDQYTLTKENKIVKIIKDNKQTGNKTISQLTEKEREEQYETLINNEI